MLTDFAVEVGALRGRGGGAAGAGPGCVRGDGRSPDRSPAGRRPGRAVRRARPLGPGVRPRAPGGQGRQPPRGRLAWARLAAGGERRRRRSLAAAGEEDRVGGRGPGLPGAGGGEGRSHPSVGRPGGAFCITPRTLHRRLCEADKLAEVDTRTPGKVRYTLRRSVEGQQRDVLVFDARTLTPSGECPECPPGGNRQQTEAEPPHAPVDTGHSPRGAGVSSPLGRVDTPRDTGHSPFGECPSATGGSAGGSGGNGHSGHSPAKGQGSGPKGKHTSRSEEPL